MKNYNILIFLVLLANVSCKKVLETEPGFPTTSNFFRNKQEIELAINGIYDPLFSGYPFYQEGLNERARHAYLGTDESTSNQRVSNNDYPTHYNSTSASSYVRGWWGIFFGGIERANIFLESIGNSTSLSKEEKDAYIGEAKFLRAHYLFLATQWFGDIPLRKSSTKSLADAQIAFTKSKEVYDYAIAEMTEAEALLSSRTASKLSYNERVTQTVVQGILARVCLFAAGAPVNDTKRYAEASQWAQKVIASGLHKLTPDYQQVFINHSSNVYDNVNRETMWQISAITGLTDATLREQWVPRVGITATSGLLATVSGWERTNPRAYYTYASGDLRRDWNIAPFWYGTSSATTPNPMTYFAAADSKWNREPGKWRRYYEPITSSGGLASSQCFPLLRYADVLLMFAEAEGMVNGPLAIGSIAGISPVDAINLVRRRGYGETKNSRGLASVTILTGGSGYRAGTTPPITFVGGTRSLRTQTIAGRPYLNEDPRATCIVSGGAITKINLITTGDCYQTLPTVVVGTAWTASTAYTLNTQVVNGGRLYTVTTAGTSGSAGPTHTTGAVANGTATLTYAGVAATAVAEFPPSADLSTNDYNTSEKFIKLIRDERLRELAFENLRRQDLKRWGILIETVRKIGVEVGAGSDELNPDGTKLYGPYTIPRNAAPFNAASNIFSTGPNSITEKDIFLPIPLSEILYNKLSTQNPGF
ncbi:RagB/SusD family nutrient uptake outer membrane protein [Lacibacter sp. H375]|uniref:RagB/SusD family nutrient uptake outer membrane protein n=1 Tax=Lacibacter sp. H375 TaxID=3133424 RepID=UPI0030C019AC